MANKRIFYAHQRAGITSLYSNTFQTIRGLQTLGTTTTFNLEQVFEIGQLALYENIEGVPDVEVQTEKVLDGYTPTYLLATQKDVDNNLPSESTLVGRAPGICQMAISIYAEETAAGYAEGAPGSEVRMSGLYVSSVGYSVGVDGNATETCTLVGNNKVWVIGGDTANFVDGTSLAEAVWDTPWSGGDLAPGSAGAGGGVNQRQDVIFGSGTAVGIIDNGVSLIPIGMPGVTTVETSTSGVNVASTVDGAYGVHIQNWNISTDFGREELFELGNRGTYYRYVNFPVEVTNEFTVISISGDLISSTENGIYGAAAGCGGTYNLLDTRIRLVMCEGLVVDCGSVNKLSSVGVTGGDAGGGNVEVTYSYSNFNDFDVKHPADPVVALRP